MKKTSSFQNSLIWFGAAVSIAEILTGTYFAPLGFGKGLLAILIGWIIFNSPSLGAAGKYLRALCFLGEGTGADAPFFLLTLRQYGLQLAAALALCTPVGKRLLERLASQTEPADPAAMNPAFDAARFDALQKEAL